ncbi:MAG: N-acetylmuramoyl-L-alanine amidase [Atopostipes suicloacalis]|nr:N-acetylmuramoyl-L-alanine amidase [Atopostipes suicloacalis]
MASSNFSNKIKTYLPRKNIFLLAIFVILSLTVSSLVVLANENTVLVEADILNVRYGPGLSHEVLANVKEGDRLHVLGEENKWYKVRLKNNQIGWIASWLVDNKKLISKNQKFIRVNTPAVNIRKFANSNSEILGIVRDSTELQVLYEDGDWYQIIYMGQVAWIHKDYTEVIDGLVETEIIADEKGQESTRVTKVNSLAEATIVIDAGHGGKDSGAISADQSIFEKDLALNTALLLRNRLKDAGTNVILTRNQDVYISLDDRVSLSNKHEADAFISIHYDAVEQANTMSGTTTYYQKDDNFELAKIVNSYLDTQGALPNNGVRLADYQVLRENTQTAILLELGYMNHNKDTQVITSAGYQATIVEAIYQALGEYYQN